MLVMFSMMSFHLSMRLVPKVRFRSVHEGTHFEINDSGFHAILEM